MRLTDAECRAIAEKAVAWRRELMVKLKRENLPKQARDRAYKKLKGAKR